MLFIVKWNTPRTNGRELVVGAKDAEAAECKVRYFARHIPDFEVTEVKNREVNDLK